jgi:hypothetical protein
VLTSGEIVSPSSDDAASLAKHWMTLSRSSFTSPNAPKHRGIMCVFNKRTRASPGSDSV